MLLQISPFINGKFCQTRLKQADELSWKPIRRPAQADGKAKQALLLPANPFPPALELPAMIDAPTFQQPLVDRLNSAITDHPYLANRNLRFETEGSRVTLHGVVSSYFHKQMAQEALRRLDGVEHIENKLEVNWA